MKKIRVLIVDDSVVVRRFLRNALRSDAGIEVVGVASNGRLGLEQVRRLNPDLVVLDIEMPEMNGLEMLTELRASDVRIPVIMFSTLTERGASATLEALSRGASDYVTKPTNSSSLEDAMDDVRAQLLPRIKALAGPPESVEAPKERSPTPRVWSSRRVRSSKISAVVIAVSTGGPEALARVIPVLPADLAVPVLIVQHMPPVFTRMLAERLDAKSGLTVREGVAGAVVRPGDVWIAPGGRHMEVVRRSTGIEITLQDGPPENSCRPAADVLFRSAVRVWGGALLGVVMTGMGQDGFLGSTAIWEEGGRVLAQDEKSSVVWGMPGAVAAARIVDQILPLEELGSAMTRMVSATASSSRLDVASGLTKGS